MIKRSMILVSVILTVGCSKPVLRSKMESNVPHTFYESTAVEAKPTSIAPPPTVHKLILVSESTEPTDDISNEAESIVGETACELSTSRLEQFQTIAEVAAFLRQNEPDHQAEVDCKGYDKKPTKCMLHTYGCGDKILEIIYLKSDTLFLVKEFIIKDFE